MAIIGLTDRVSQDSRILGRVEISVFKGDRKPTTGYGFGKDLNQSLRITTTNNVAAIVLKQSKQYGLPKENGDFVTDKINIYLPFDQVERTFFTSMKAYDASGLKVVCDRNTISKECVPTKDEKGNNYRPIMNVDKPCPMTGCGIAEQCPNGCQKEGKFYFYIKELLDKDLMMPCVLTTHSFEDLTYLTDILTEYGEMLGTLTNSPFPAYQYRHKIPFILSRSEVKIKRPVVKDKLRTGTKAEGTTWALTLQIDPDFMELHRKWQQVREMESRKMLVSSATVAGLLSGDSSTVIDVEVISETPKQLLPAEDPVIAEKYRQRIIQRANEYFSLTGEDYGLPSLTNKTLSELEIIGKKIKADVDDAKLLIAQSSYEYQHLETTETA